MSGLDVFLHTLDVKEKARLPLPKDFDPVAEHAANRQDLTILKLLHVSIEKGMPCNPQDIGVGGVGVFVSSLTGVQKLQNNLDSRVILPFYPALNNLKLEYVKSVTHYFNVSCVQSEIWLYHNKNGVKEYFVKSDIKYQHIFQKIESNEQIYADLLGSSLIQRISYFCGAVAAFGMVGDNTKDANFLPHILQIHGFSCALVGKLIHKYRELYGDQNNSYCSPYTIYNVHSQHSLGYRYDFDSVPAIGLSKEKTMYLDEDAIKYHDHLVYVSPQLLAESVMETCPFFELVRERVEQHKCSIILNNILANDFDPTICLEGNHNFDPDKIADCKQKLKEHLNREFFSTFQRQVNAEFPLIIFVGRYTKDKGIDFLELAIEVALVNGASFVCMGYGESEIISNLKSKYCESKNIIFIAKDDQYTWGNKIRCAADIYFVPSLLEACGLVPMEASVAGAFVVSSSVCGLKEVVIDNSNGAKFTDVASAYDTLQSVIDAWLNLKQSGNLNLALKVVCQSARETFNWLSKTSGSARKYELLYYDMHVRHKLNI